MIAPLERFRFRFHDWLYYSRLPREASGLLHFLRGVVTRDTANKLERAIDGYRFSSIPPLKKYALRKIRSHIPDPIWREQKVGWSRYAEQLEDPALTRTVVLKAPGENGEKGAMLLTFEYNWLRLLSAVPDLQKLEEKYDIIFSTSSSPTNYQILALAASSLRGTVFVQSCNYSESADIEALHPRVKCLPMLPCDWIQPGLAKPKPFAERDVDLLMVANWDLFKRQWQFFEALKSLPKNLRIVMIGQPAGRYDIDFARHTSKLFGARQEIEFYQSLTIDEVADYQSRSKVSAIFSRREGCCVAITESLMADTPVAMLSDAHVGPRAYINSQTGVLLKRRRRLGAQLQAFLESAESFQPRAWAEANIAAPISTEKLNRVLRENAEAEQRPWTTDLMEPCWRAHPTLKYNPEMNRLRPTYAALHEEYPQLFPADLIETSGR
jgi:glycosyltransferase involved in cell wall biosynthesis